MATLENPSLKGVYTFAQFSTNYPMVLDLTYPISEIDWDTGFPYMDDIEIGSILVSGDDIFVSWTNNITGSFGIDKVDYNVKFEYAYIETTLQTIYRQQLANFSNIDVAYVTLPTGTAIYLAYCTDFDETFIPSTVEGGTNDTMRSLVSFEEGFDSTILFLRIYLFSLNNEAPSIDSVIISTS